MKLQEVALGSLAHANLIAQNKGCTVSRLKDKLRSSTMPQAQIDALLQALNTVSPDKKLNHKDLQDLAFASEASLDELELLTGIEA